LADTSVANIVTVYVPKTVGLPVITPVFGFIVIPAGKFIALNIKLSPSKSLATALKLTILPAISVLFEIGDKTGV
jgi:hypothetical protein